MGGRTKTPETTIPSPKKAGKGTQGDADRDSSRDDCELSFRSALQGLDQAAVKKLTRGDVLSVHKIDNHPFPSVVCRNMTTTETVGSLASSGKVVELMACIDLGNVYRARVLDVAPACLVQVYREAKGTSK